MSGRDTGVTTIASDQARCSVCNKPITIVPGHRPRCYCSDICKQRVYTGRAMKRFRASLRSTYPTFTEGTLDVLIELETSGHHEWAENLIRVIFLELGFEPDPFPWIALYTKRYWQPGHARQLQRAKEAGLEATLVLDAWMRTVRAFGGLCAYCRNRAGVVIEHIIPVSKGGGTTVDNCVPACSHCNGSKSDKMLEDWITLEVEDLLQWLYQERARRREEIHRLSELTQDLQMQLEAAHCRIVELESSRQALDDCIMMKSPSNNERPGL